MVTKTVTIPACEIHHGLFKIDVTLGWICPKCGGERGEVYKGRSYDGSRWMEVDCWDNPCGHVDKYDAVRKEVANDNT